MERDRTESHGPARKGWLYQYTDHKGIARFRRGGGVISVHVTEDRRLRVVDVRTRQEYWSVELKDHLDTNERFKLFDADPGGNFAVLLTNRNRLVTVGLLEPDPPIHVSEAAFDGWIENLVAFQAGFAFRVISIRAGGDWRHRTVNLKEEPVPLLQPDEFGAEPTRLTRLPDSARFLCVSEDRTSSLWYESGRIGMLANAGYEAVPVTVSPGEIDMWVARPAPDSPRAFTFQRDSNVFLLRFERTGPSVRKFQVVDRVAESRGENAPVVRYLGKPRALLAMPSGPSNLWIDAGRLEKALDTGRLELDLGADSKELSIASGAFDQVFTIAGRFIVLSNEGFSAVATISGKEARAQRKLDGVKIRIVSGGSRFTTLTEILGFLRGVPTAEKDGDTMAALCVWPLLPIGIPTGASGYAAGEPVFFLKRHEDFDRSAITMVGRIRISDPKKSRVRPSPAATRTLLVEAVRSIRGRAESSLSVARMRELDDFRDRTFLTGRENARFFELPEQVSEPLRALSRLHRTDQKWTPTEASDWIAQTAARPPYEDAEESEDTPDFDAEDPDDRDPDDVDPDASVADELEGRGAPGTPEETDRPGISSAGAPAGGRDGEDGIADPEDISATAWFGDIRVDLDADTLPSRDDPMDVAREVEALASLAAARDFAPPLSVAVFGDWGAGKTTIMRAIESQIGRLRGGTWVKRTVLPGPDGAGPVTRAEEHRYLDHIVPIWFNAWHYSEANLIVSLANTVLLELAKHLKGDELSKAFRVRNELDARAAELTAEIEAAEHEKAEAIETRKNRREIVRSAWRATVNWARDERTDFSALNKSAETLGFGSSLAEAHEGLIDAVRHRNAAKQAFGHFFSTRSGAWKRVRWALLAVGILFAASQLADHVNPWLSWIVGAIGSAAAIILPSLFAVNKAVAALDGFARHFELERNAEVVEKERAIADARRSLEELEAERRDVARRIRRLTDGLSATEVVAEIQDIIEARIAGGEYSAHLGIVSTVYEDFKRLSDILTRSQGAVQDPTGPADEDDGTEADDPDETAQTGPPNSAEPGVERVVLFIDDLDRCAPERVVAVLQAVHLLLSFPLFICYVGVDSRWLKRSIAHSYRDTIGDGASHSSAVEDGVVLLPNDYLEKVFHLSFWVPGMREANKMIVLESLIERGFQEHAPGRLGVMASPHGAAAALLHLTTAEKRYLSSLARFAGDTPRRLQRFFTSYCLFRGTLEPDAALPRFVGDPDVIELPGFMVVGALTALISRCRTITAPVLRDLLIHYRETRELEADQRFTDIAGQLIAVHSHLAPNEARIAARILGVLEETMTLSGLDLEPQAAGYFRRYVRTMIRFSLFDIALDPA